MGKTGKIIKKCREASILVTLASRHFSTPYLDYHPAPKNHINPRRKPRRTNYGAAPHSLHLASSLLKGENATSGASADTRVTPDDSCQICIGALLLYRLYIGARPYGPFVSLRQGKETACRCGNRQARVIGEFGPVCLATKTAWAGDVMAAKDAACRCGNRRTKETSEKGQSDESPTVDNPITFKYNDKEEGDAEGCMRYIFIRIKAEEHQY